MKHHYADLGDLRLHAQRSRREPVFAASSITSPIIPVCPVPLSKTGSMGYQQRFLKALHDIHFRCVLVTLENGCSPRISSGVVL